MTRERLGVRHFSVQRRLLERKAGASSRPTCFLKSSSGAYTAAVTTRAPHSAPTHISSRGKKETCSSIRHVTSRNWSRPSSVWADVTDVLLSHQDDVADADKYADRFGARVWIHDDDRSAAAYATNVLKGTEITDIGGNLIAIPVPGHTRGSVVYLWHDTYLFSGDSLAWSREAHDLVAFREACWYSWSELKRSLGRLGEYQFEWILPGHGHSVHLPLAEMNARLRALVDRM